MAVPAIPLSDLRMEPEDLDAVERVLRSGRLRAGAEVEAFETEWAAHIGVAHAVAVSSCTAALQLAYLAAGVGPGDEVIVPSITFAASAAAVRHCGGTPVFADIIGPADGGIDPADVAARITPRTRAVCVVHFAGYPAAVEALTALCAEHGLAVVEDAAHSPLAEVKGRKAGAWGQSGCFSFFSNKVLAVGEGGVLTTDDDAVAAAARAGRDGPWNLRMDEPRAALLRSRMRRLEADVDARRALTRRYRALTSGLDGIGAPYTDEAVGRSSCYVMPLVLEDLGRQEAVRRRMRERHGVQTSLLYPAVHELTAYRGRYGASLPSAERFARTELTVPLFAFLSEADQDRVVSALADALEHVA